MASKLPINGNDHLENLKKAYKANPKDPQKEYQKYFDAVALSVTPQDPPKPPPNKPEMRPKYVRYQGQLEKCYDA